MQSAYNKLIAGYRNFRQQYCSPENDNFRHRVGRNQQPKTMFITCSDSRVNPAVLTQSGLGEIFLVCNVANLVPRCDKQNIRHHATCAALEFAVLHLRVQNIVILGHSGCGGIKALLAQEAQANTEATSYIDNWLAIAAAAKQKVIAHNPSATASELQRLCERESLLASLANLDTFPWIAQAKQAGHLQLHAWYFNIASGQIDQYQQSRQVFTPLLPE